MKNPPVKSKPKTRRTTAKPRGVVVHRPCSGDLRSPLAKARDAWFKSRAGKICADASTLVNITYPSSFLRNRLEVAFLAGAKFSQNAAGQAITRKETPDTQTDEN